MHAGKSETFGEKLKSILAQFEFAYQIRYWESENVPFRTHLHVPEHHPITAYLFCEREDEGHLFKVWPWDVYIIMYLHVSNCIAV